MTQLEMDMLKAAAKAAGMHVLYEQSSGLMIDSDGCAGGYIWNPYNSDEDLMELARKLKINIDYHDCSAWHRTHRELFQDYWGDEYDDEAHCIVHVAAQIGGYKS